MRRLTVIALGGNALVQRGEEGTLEEQQAHVEETVVPVVRAGALGTPLIITHGNGPVVGQMLLQSELASAQVHPMPLFIMDAESQGSVGFLIQQAVSNQLRAEGVEREVVTLVTRVVVDAADPSFKDPTKPVGVFYTQPEAERLRAGKGWIMEEDSGRGFRRRVPSPRPLLIPEAPIIGRLARRGVITIAAGGGGVPVVEDLHGRLQGVDAVVDKDLASALLGNQAGAEKLLILTSIDAVYTGFGTPGQKGWSRMTAARASALLAKGEFAPGSMGPKIQAALQFLHDGGHEVRIGLPQQAPEILLGRAGTLITV